MPSKHDYVPYHDDELPAFAGTFYAYASAHYSQWSIPSPQNPIEDDIGNYERMLPAYKEPNHGKVNTLNKNEAKRTLTTDLRVYIRGYVARNPKVTDEDRGADESGAFISMGEADYATAYENGAESAAPRTMSRA